MALKRNVRGGVPSPYPRLPFHGLRGMQLLSSIVVAGIMSYFIYYMRLEVIPIPWTFIILLTVSLFTILSLTFTICLYNFTYLSPRFNLILNGTLSLIWATGFGLICWSVSTSHILAKYCSPEVWRGQNTSGEPEAAICRDYKALWAMALVGTLSTFAAAALDTHTQKKTTRRGVYAVPEDDKDAQKLNDLKGMRVRSQGYSAPEEQNDVVQRPGGVSKLNLELEEDIAYHSRYGAEETHGPLDGYDRRVGYSDRE